MNKKLNIKKWLPLIFFALFVVDFWFFWFGWKYFPYKIPLTVINGSDWFMFKAFHWLHATSYIFGYGPLVSSAIFLLLALYSWIIGIKRDYNNEETDLLWWNKKVLYSIGFLMLSALSFRSEDFWMNFYEKISTTNIDYFMLENLKLGFTTFDIFFNCPLVLGVIFFIFYMYFGIKGLKQSFGIEKKRMLIIVPSMVLLGILLFLIEVFFVFGL